MNKIARFFRYTASLANRRELPVQFDVNSVYQAQKEKEKEKENKSNAGPNNAINYDILKAVDKVTDTNSVLMSWLYDEAKDDPFSDSPDILLRKNWVPRSRMLFFFLC